MPDTQIHPLGTVTAPGDFKIPGSAELQLKGVYASFDGSAAASSFIPLVRFISDAGSVALEAVADTTIAAGGSADASWFPRVAAAAAKATSSGQGVLVAEQLIGTTQTFTAGTTSAIVWDSIVADSSGAYNVGVGHGATFKITQTGTYLVSFQFLPDPSWPTVANGPVVFRPDVPLLIIPYSQLNSYTPGSINIGGFMAVVSTYAGVPATVAIDVNNQSSVNVASIGGGPANNGTALAVTRLGPEVLLP